MAAGKRLTHVDAAGRPRMVDVSAKAVTARSAIARCEVVFPRDVADAARQMARHDSVRFVSFRQLVDWLDALEV